MATPVFPTNDRLQDLSPAAGTTELAYDFELKSETGLSIERVRAGARSILANGVDYDFPAGLGDASGGTVTLSAATLAGDRYLLIGREPIARQSDLYDNNAFRAERYNEDGDFTTLIAQELRRDVDRAMKADYGQSGLSIDTSVVKAGKTLMRGPGDTIVPGPDAEDIVNAQANAAIATQKAAIATTKADEAATARDEAVNAANSINTPLITPGDGGRYLAVKGDESGSEWVSPLITKPNLGLAAPSTVGSAIDVLESRSYQSTIARNMRIDPVLDRASPVWMVFEPWALAAELTQWVNASGDPVDIAETATREHVRTHADAGVRAFYWKYIEIFGHWFYRPSFNKWTDGDTGLAGADWSTFSARNQDFDMTEIFVDECRVLGLPVALSAGRCGYLRALADIAGATSSYAGVDAATLRQNVVDRTRQIIADLDTKFDSYGNVVAYASGFEPGNITIIDNLWKDFTLNEGASVHPTARSHGKQFWITCAALTDLPQLTDSIATKEAYALKMRNSGAQLWIQQDAVGPGNDYVNARYTGCPSVTIAQLPDFYRRLNAIADIANAASDNFGTAVEFAGMPEAWRNGENPEYPITLSGTVGTLTVTLGGGGVWPTNVVNRWIVAGAAGAGKVTIRNSDTVITISTGLTSGDGFSGAVFSGTSYAANTVFVQTWSIVGDPDNNAFYGWAIPAPGVQYLSQMQAAARFSSMLFCYAGSSFATADTMTAKLPQAVSGITDYRDRADALFDTIKGARSGAALRQQVSRTILPRNFAFNPITPGTLSGGAYSADPFKYYPRETWTKARLTIEASMYRGETANVFVNDVTLQLRINGIAQGVLLFAGGKDGVFSGTFSLKREYEHVGPPFTIGLVASYQTAAGHPTLASVSCSILEYPEE